jgi:hypothetical protein
MSGRVVWVSMYLTRRQPVPQITPTAEGDGAGADAA